MSSLRRGLVVAGLVAVPLAVLVVFFVLPVAAMIGRGFDHGWAGVLEVFGRDRTRRVLWFTVWSSLMATGMSLLLGLPAAYATHRLAWRGRSLVRAALMVPFVLPTVVVGVAFRQLMSGGVLARFDGTATAIVAGLVFFNVAVVIRVVGSAWEGLDPRPGQAAASLGAGPVRVWWTITMPMLRSSITSAAVVVFLYCATAFGIVLMLGGVHYSSVETEIYLLTVNYFDLQAAAALSLLQLGIVVALLLAASVFATGVRTPTRATLVRPSGPGWLALGHTLVLVVILAVPVAAMGLASVRADGDWTTRYWRSLGAIDDLDALAALGVSLRTAVDATWMALLLGVLIAVAVSRPARSRAERRLLHGLDGTFMLPLGVSAVTLGFGFLIGLPLGLRDSALLVPIAQALVALPLVIRVLAPVLGRIDDRQRQAAATLGASGLRAFVTVDAAALRRPLVTAAGFAFAISMGEFGATSFLARDDSLTLPLVVYRLISRPGELNYGTAMAAAVLLAVVVSVVMGLAELIGGGRSRVAT